MHTYLLFPFTIVRSLRTRETLSDSFLGIARAFVKTGRVVPSLLMPPLPLEDPDLQDMKFQKLNITLQELNDFQVYKGNKKYITQNEKQLKIFGEKKDCKPLITNDSVKLF